MVRGGATVATVETWLFGRADKVWGRDDQFLYKRPKTVFLTVHVAMSIALTGLVATAMTLQHMDLIAMQFS